jgi:hypothetical protein
MSISGTVRLGAANRNRLIDCWYGNSVDGGHLSEAVVVTT